MTTDTRPDWGRILRIVLIGTAVKFAIVGAAYLLAMDMLHSPVA